MKNFDPNKAHGHDMISIRILKLWRDPVLPSLERIFKSCLKSDTFSSEWKKANAVLIHKKGDKKSFKNYRSILLLRSDEKQAPN